MTPSVFTVAETWSESADTFTMRLTSEKNKSSCQFEPGQFNMLYAFGVGESAISISGHPGPGERGFVHTIRRVGSVTGSLARLKVGDQVGLRGPFGVGWPLGQMQGRDLVLVAGGIGLAPIRPILYKVAEDRSNFRRVTLLYGARTPKDLLFVDELKSLSGLNDINVQITVDHAPPTWWGRVGVVPSLIARASFDPYNGLALMCGPEIMMRFAVEELLKLGLDKDNIFLSLERSMKCGIGLCGHCQYAPFFLCKDGPVFSYSRLQPFFGLKEL